MYRTILLSACLLIGFNACIPSNVFEKNVDIPHHQWKHEFKPHIEFDITDTTSFYAMYLTMRHSDAYPFSNIWLNLRTLAPGAQQFTQSRIEVPLAQADGKWLGRHMNEMFEIADHQMPLQSDGVLKFNRTGRYIIELEQIMRTNPLPQVMSVGIRLEKLIR